MNVTAVASEIPERVTLRRRGACRTTQPELREKPNVTMPDGPTEEHAPAFPPPGPPAYDPMAAGPGYAPPPARPGRRKLIIRAAAVLILIVIVGGFFLFRDRVSNNVTSLQPGECFDQPAAGQTVITAVQRQPCNEAHDAEVFALATDSAAADAIYPVLSDHFLQLAIDQCVPAAEPYLGEALATHPELDAGFFLPTRDSWQKGDRVVACYFYRIDGAKMTASLRN